MPKATVIQTDFSGGEYSPLVYGRVDTPRYKQGLATCLNYFPTLQGSLARTPGTKYMNAVKNSAATPPVLIPFKFSETQAYVLEVGNTYIRFYANNGQIVTTATQYQVVGTKNDATTNFYATRLNTNTGFGETITSVITVAAGSVFELQNPYVFEDVTLIRWAQNADVLYLTHPQVPTQKISRFGQTVWTIEDVYFQDGPYLPLNSYLNPGDSTRVYLVPEGATGVITVNTAPTYSISAIANNGAGAIRVTTSSAHSYQTGDAVYIGGVTGTAANSINCSKGALNPPTYNSNTFWDIVYVSTTQFDLVGSTYSSSSFSGGTVSPALFNTSYSSGFTGGVDLYRKISFSFNGARTWGTISALNSAASCQVYLDPNNLVPLPSAAVGTNILVWQLGVYSFANGFPSSCTFHQNRLVLAAPANYPQELDGSTTGSFENFAPSAPSTYVVGDSNAYQFTLASQDVNAIRWLKSNQNGLLCGTYTAEFCVSASTQNEALTPTNVNASQTSSFGSAAHDAVVMANAALYIQRAGRKVRELNYFWQLGTFKSTDLTELSEQLTLPTIIQLAVQNETQPIVWAVRSDGVLLSLTYDRDLQNLKAGWGRHILGGQSDASGTNPIVTSIAVIPSPDTTFDQLWMIVKRWINGATVYTIEYMTKIFDSSVLQEDAFHLSCGGTYDNPITITGITNVAGAVVTAPAHGFANGDTVQIVGVVGMTYTTTDVNGVVTKTNGVNYLTFTIGNATTNTFELYDYQANPIDLSTFSAYVSGGQVRKRVTIISNLNWLENETVNVWADGSNHPPCVVSNSGSITLNYPAAKVQVGYGYVSQGQMLRQDAGAADGTSIGNTRRNVRAAIMMYRIMDLLIGTNFNRLLPIEYQQADVQDADLATPLFSGIIRNGLDSVYDLEGQFCFEQTTPAPGIIQAITLYMEEFSV